MPPRTRGLKASKASKENISTVAKNKVKTASKATKPARKPLADKTNSASDENASPRPVQKVVQKSTKSSRKVVPEVIDEERPRRNRRLPTRYIENQVLNNLSNSKEGAITPSKTDPKTPIKDSCKVDSPFQTPNNTDNSLLANRPRRVSRLPSKFDEQLESPYKGTIQPCHTSTPLVQKSKDLLKSVQRTSDNKLKEELQKAPQKVTPQKLTRQKITSQKVISQKAIQQKVTPQKAPQINATPQKVISQKAKQQKVTPQKVSQIKVTPQKVISQKAKQQKVTPQKVSQIKVTPQKVISQNGHQKNASPEPKLTTRLVQKKLTEVIENNKNTNNVAQRAKRLRKPVAYKEVTLSPKLKSPEASIASNNNGKKILNVNSSYRVLENKKSNGDNLDIYEFTFDPTQEPPPQQKKKKKVTNKKPAKPKTRVYKNNYEKNLARALADLKNAVTKKSKNTGATSDVVKPVVASNPEQIAITTQPRVPNPSAVVIYTTAEIHSNPDTNNSVKSNIANKNNASIRVEDIAADFEATINHHDDINYSPVNSPHENIIEMDNIGNVSPDRDAIRFDDPLNLRNELSFFDEQPAANSSMNVSTRNPTATPWRVEFENLPIKWQANTYVKPDMTPALESSYINQFDNSKKKHIYTNMVAQENDVLPDIVENEAPKLKQTSIISFIKEVIEKSASKKKKGAETPKKANSLFDDPNTSVNNFDTNEVVTPGKDTSGSSKQNSSSENNTSAESNKGHKRKNEDDINPTPAKISREDKENTLFGFDDSENQQENVPPVKVANKNRLRSLRSGAVLKESNKQTGPMRADLPAAMKSKMAPSSDIVEKIYDQIKSAADAPLLDDQQDRVEATNVADMPDGRLSMDDDSQSVHLFEDVELVHHLKPTRKSYGKSKKVTFRQHSSDSAELEEPARNSSSDEDDLSFHLPEVKVKKATKRKKTKKQLQSKKEKAEADAWAACFNSMCEDIEEFDLVVE